MYKLLTLALLFFATQGLFAQTERKVRVRGTLHMSYSLNNYGLEYGSLRPLDVGTHWTLKVGGGQINSSFKFCAVKDGRFLGCDPKLGITDQYGNWTLMGIFPDWSVGNWTEWVEFPDGTMTNRISFTVRGKNQRSYFEAELTINGATAGVFHAGQDWTLEFGSLQSSGFEVCAESSGMYLGCTTYQNIVELKSSLTTKWILQGKFTSETLGGWTIWALFRNGYTSNPVSFIVDDAPLDDLTCAKGTLRPSGPSAGFANFRRRVTDWIVPFPAPYTILGNHTGGIGKTLQYLGCNDNNSVWLRWRWGVLDTVAVRAPWAGQTDRGLKIGDTYDRFITLYPAAHPSRLMSKPQRDWPLDAEVWDTGPLRVALRGGKVERIIAAWSSLEGGSNDDQKDIVEPVIGPYDDGLVWK